VEGELSQARVGVKSGSSVGLQERDESTRLVRNDLDVLDGAVAYEREELIDRCVARKVAYVDRPHHRGLLLLVAAHVTQLSDG